MGMERESSASNEKGIGLSYTPYLSKLVDDIFLGNILFFKKLVIIDYL